MLSLTPSELPVPQLHPMIYSNFKNQSKRLFGWDETLTENFSKPVLQIISSKEFQTGSDFREEFFGPQSILVFYDSYEELLNNLTFLEGQLTATLITSDTASKGIVNVIEVLKSKAGRIIFNGVPTGVTVCESMVHGGLYPSSSDSRYTAVGGRSTARFIRSISYQNTPNSLLPDCLRD